MDEDCEPSVQATAWRMLAEARTYLGELADARESYRESVRWARASGDDKLLGEVLVGCFGALSGLEDPEAESCAEEARERLERTGHEAYLAKLYMNLGNAAFHGEDPARAHAQYTKAREALDRLGDHGPTYWSLLDNLGIASTQLLRLAEARTIFEEVISRGRDSGNNHLVAHAKFNLSFVDRAEGQYAEALRRLETAEATFRALAAEDLIALVRLSRAEVYLDLGLSEDARTQAAAANRDFETQEKVIDATYAALVEAESWSQGGHHSKAREAFRSIVEKSQSEGQLRRRIESSLGLARVALRLGEIPDLMDLLPPYPDADGLETVRAEAEILRTRAAVANEDLDCAGDRIEEVIARQERLPRKTAIEAWTLAGAIHRRLGKIDRSREFLSKGVHAAEDLRRTVPGAELRAAAYHAHHEALREQLETEIAAGAPTAHLLSLGRAMRARSFRDRRPRRKLPPELQEQQAQLSALMNRFDRDRILESDTAVRELEAEVRRMESQVLEAVRRWDATEARPEPSSEPNNDSAFAAATTPEPGAAWIEFFPAASSILVAVRTSESESVVVLDRDCRFVENKLSELTFQVDSFLALRTAAIAESSFLKSAADSVLGDLYDALIRPLEPLLSGIGVLRVVPTAFLHQVPLASLWDGNRYLCEHFDISVHLGTDTPANDVSIDSIALLAIAGSGPKHAVSEVEAIEAGLSANWTSVYIDPTAETFLSILRSHSVVHLAAHSVFQGTVPLFSRLALQDRSLLLLDLLQDELDTELVVLGTCESGRTHRRSGDELRGLAHAFLASGVKQLVASLWRVDDEATRALMIEFYRGLRGENRTPAASLCEAMRSIRKQGFDHPFLWSAFTTLSL